MPWFRALYDLEPFGTHRDALNTAIVAFTIAQAHRSPDGPKLALEDFLLTVDGNGTPKQDLAVMCDAVITLNQMFGGKDKRRGPD